MKRVVSISLGSSRRNQQVETTLLGQPIVLERIGVDGDVAAARRMFLDLDGKVDAFGVGGADLGITVAGCTYPIHSLTHLVADLQTPAVDGGVLRRVVERGLVPRLAAVLPTLVVEKRVLICVSVARWDLAASFSRAGYQTLFGDLGFGLGLPIPIRSLRMARCVARVALPIMCRMPFEWLYPTGEKQEKSVPRFQSWYDWATVIADDFHYIKQHMPERLPGKIIVTNTTTPADIESLRQRGVAWLCTSTPRLEGRTFGTNVMEAALVALAGKGRSLTTDEVAEMVREEDLAPDLLQLNPA
jgi:hypothetical protein